MLIEEQFRALVLEVAEMAALIGTRLRPVFLRPGETLPAATYRRHGTLFPSDTLDNEGFEQVSMELIVWGFEYVDIKAAVAAVKTALRTGAFTAPLHVITITNEEDVFDEKFQHPDGVGVPGTRLECQLTLSA